MYVEIIVVGIYCYFYKKFFFIEEFYKYDRKKEKKKFRLIIFDYGIVFGSYRNKYLLNIGKYFF